MQHTSGIFAAIEQSSAALFIRDSLLLYPAANVAHVIAVIGFFAIVAAMDAVLLGLIPGAQPFTTKQRLRPVALAAFALIVVSGLIMFVAEAAAMARNTAFQFKMLAILAGAANLIVLEGLAQSGEVTRGVRVAAGLSLAIWLITAAVGRIIAYA